MERADWECTVGPLQQAPTRQGCLQGFCLPSSSSGGLVESYMHFMLTAQAS